MATMTTTLAIANQKGGVAKTTTVASLGAALTDLGADVLVVDLDPQSCLTFSLGVDPEVLDESVHQVLLGTTSAADVIVATDDGPDLLPATIELAGCEGALLMRPGREHALRVALEPVSADYDWILLDCPPSLGVLTVAALSAAGAVLIPLQCETLSHRGVGQLLSSIDDVRRLTNRGLVVRGILPTMFDGRTNHAKEVLADVGSRYGLPVLEPAIRKSIRFAEAPRDGRSILRYAPSHPGSEAYRDLARQLAS
jgi:chromosome partitioning protein